MTERKGFMGDRRGSSDSPLKTDFLKSLYIIISATLLKPEIQ